MTDWRAPVVTVIVVAGEGAATVLEAIQSVRRQSLTAIEIIVADGAAAQATAALAAADNRIRIMPAAARPAAALGEAVAAAAGTWVAILDGGDRMHPDRLRQLVAAAAADGVDVAADNALVFYPDASRRPHGLLPEAVPRTLGLVEFIDTAAAAGCAGLLFRRSALADGDALAAAGAFTLACQLLARGATLRAYPGLGLFRRHPDKAGFGRALAEMDTLADGARPGLGQAGPALERYARRLRRGLHAEHLVTASKGGRWTQAVRGAARLPLPALATLDRMRAVRRPPPPAGPRSVCLISRQRIVGNTNGSSAYLLSLCEAIRRAGWAVHLVCPSPATFGRWPFLKLQPEMAVFASIAQRGGWRIGQTVLALDPRVLAQAALTVADRILARVGLSSGHRVPPAPYAIAVPWQVADQLFVARHASRHADALMADYAFLTDGLAFALRPDAPSLVVMHDLFSARAAQFSQLGSTDSVAIVTLAEEMAMLGRADAVLAIQAEEGAAVRAGLPGHRVIVAPMAIQPVAAPQPGTGAGLLFVGSKAAPNVDGLQWFLREVWPTLLLAVPEATLAVVGTVGEEVGAVPPGVSLLGRVADLPPLYAAAAVVVSPLRVGSGLKIKLIEALGHGKAIVATPVTVQGVETMVEGATLIETTAAGTAAAVAGLLRDPAERAALAGRALAAAQTHFSAEACYGEAIAFLAAGRNLVGVDR